MSLILITTTMISITTHRKVDKQHVTSFSSAFPPPNYLQGCGSSAGTSSKQKDMLALPFDKTQGIMHPFDRDSCDGYSKSQGPGSRFSRRHFFNNSNASFPFRTNLQHVKKWHPLVPTTKTISSRQPQYKRVYGYN
jgi:hypothetical protein